MIVDGVGEGQLTTTPAQDTFTPTWNDARNISIAKGDRLRIRVVDADALFDDPVAELSFVFLGPQRYTLSRPEASLDDLVLEVRPPSAERRPD